jgi:glycosyltransferase involved in cell wall biosynthesis
MRIWVIVPAYNEASFLARLLNDIKKTGLFVLVIDDGSIDATYDTAKGIADIVLRNNKNMGKGKALHAAIAYLLEHEAFDYAITMDGDGQHSPGDLKQFIAAANNDESFVVGTRMGNPQGMPLIRVITNIVMSRIISNIARQNIPDSQCGYRLIKREVLEKVEIETKKFEIESEILIKAARFGYRIKSIPVESIYAKNQRSKINPFVDTIRFFRFLFYLRGR